MAILADQSALQKKGNMRALYVGKLFPGETSLQRMLALERLGHCVVGVLGDDPSKRKSLRGLISRAKYWAYRKGVKVFGLDDVIGTNRNICDNVEQSSFDYVWIDKGLTISPGTLEYIKERQPNCWIVGYSPDDMGQRHNQSLQFIRSLPLYDLFITTKSYNVSELQALGGRHVMFVNNAFAPELHRPVELSDAERRTYTSDVLFIGNFEIDRATRLNHLAEAGVNVDVWCSNWPARYQVHPNIRLHKQILWNEEYVKGICGAKIALCFLRKLNRDLQTTRSIEIPACRTFMLGERTSEHQLLFKEGVEAEFFETSDELVEKTKFYLHHETERIRVAEQGYQRCWQSGYDNDSILRRILSSLSRKQ